MNKYLCHKPNPQPPQKSFSLARSRRVARNSQICVLLNPEESHSKPGREEYLSPFCETTKKEIARRLATHWCIPSTMKWSCSCKHRQFWRCVRRFVFGTFKKNRIQSFSFFHSQGLEICGFSSTCVFHIFFAFHCFFLFIGCFFRRFVEILQYCILLVFCDARASFHLYLSTSVVQKWEGKFWFFCSFCK